MTTTPTRITAPRQSATPIRFGDAQYDPQLGEIQTLRSSDDVRDDAQALNSRFAEDGYLYIPGFFDRDEVLNARRTILEYMAEHEAMEPGSRPLDGVMGQYGKSIRMIGRSAITHHPEVLNVLESSRLFEFYGQLFGETSRTFDYKWLRAVGNEQCTGAHMDEVYMGRGSKRVMTAWVALGDLALEEGTLAICRGSHNLDSFARLRASYGQADVDRDAFQGWLTTDPKSITEQFGGQWQTNAFEAGDLLTFGLWTMHASTTNVTDKWRLSCDIRFQPDAEPADPRWDGKSPIGHGPDSKGTTRHRSMEEMRANWGV